MTMVLPPTGGIIAATTVLVFGNMIGLSPELQYGAATAAFIIGTILWMASPLPTTNRPQEVNP